MADRLLCSRVYEDGCCDHPVTGERETKVVPDERRIPCIWCGHILRRDPADHPELEAVCMDHLDDDEWPG
jgi:hypothetical protein